MVNPFLEESRRAMPRLLSCLNRNEFSPTRGSFDRAFWHYRTVTAFESATFCQGALALALALRFPVFGTGYEDRPDELMGHLEAALLRWTSLQHDDGSFDEWYPFERSHVATAFTSYAVGETLLLLRDRLDAAVQKKAVTALHDAARWLSNHLDDKVLNHTAGAIPAIHTAYRMTGDEELKSGLERNLDLMAAKQSREGWFAENGGFDAGYLSLSLHYLWRYHESTRDERALAMIRRGFGFLKHLLHPDGTSGGEYTARNTKYLMPYGIIAAAEELADAAVVRDHLLRSLERGVAVTPSTTDDRYMIFFFLPNFMQAAIAADKSPPSRPTEPKPSVQKHFPEAGLVVRSTAENHCAFNYRKGGIFRFHSGERCVFADSGYFIRDASDAVYSTQFLGLPGDIQTLLLREDSAEGRVELAFPLRKVNYSLPLVHLDIPFAVFSKTLGRIPAVSRVLEKAVKDVFIRKPSVSPYRLSRRIELSGTAIVFHDRLTGPSEEAIRVSLGGESTAPHVPSSRYQVATAAEEPPFRWKGTLPLDITMRLDLESGRFTLEAKRT